MDRVISYIESYFGPRSVDNWRPFTAILGVPAFLLLPAPWSEHPWLAVPLIVLAPIILSYIWLAMRHETFNPRHWVLGQNEVRFEWPEQTTTEVEAWCRENIRGRWNRNFNRFWFSRVEDAVHFKLRWY